MARTIASNQTVVATAFAQMHYSLDRRSSRTGSSGCRACSTSRTSRCLARLGTKLTIGTTSPRCQLWAIGHPRHRSTKSATAPDCTRNSHPSGSAIGPRQFNESSVHSGHHRPCSFSTVAYWARLTRSTWLSCMRLQDGRVARHVEDHYDFVEVNDAEAERHGRSPRV